MSKTVTLGVSKKRISVSLMMCLVVLMLLLSACGGSATTTDAKPTAKPVVDAPKSLVSQGTLTVGTDATYFPMEYRDEKTNTYAGFDIELSEALAQRMGLKLNVVQTGFDTLLDDLNNKRFDIANASIYISEKRKERFDFLPYMQAGSSILVARGNPKKVNSLSDLCGLTVGVQNGTEQQKSLNSVNDKECKPKNKAVNLVNLKSMTDVANLLNTGRADAAFTGSLSAGYYSKQSNGQFEQAGPTIDSAPSGIAVRKGDTEMLNALDKAFKALKEDGTYNNLFKKYGFVDDMKL